MSGSPLTRQVAHRHRRVVERAPTLTLRGSVSQGIALHICARCSAPVCIALSSFANDIFEVPQRCLAVFAICFSTVANDRIAAMRSLATVEKQIAKTARQRCGTSKMSFAKLLSAMQTGALHRAQMCKAIPWLTEPRSVSVGARSTTRRWRWATCLVRGLPDIVELEVIQRNRRIPAIDTGISDHIRRMRAIRRGQYVENSFATRGR